MEGQKPKSKLHRRITDNREIFHRNLLIDDVVPILVDGGLLPQKTQKKYTEVNYYDRAALLLDVMEKKGEDDLAALVEALRKTGQLHMVKVLTGQGKEEVMSRMHKFVLRQKERLLRELLDLDIVLPLLAADGVLTSGDIERIYKLPSKEERVIKFVVYITRKSDSAFEKFLKALRNTKQHKLAAILEQVPLLEEIKIKLPVIRPPLPPEISTRKKTPPKAVEPEPELPESFRRAAREDGTLRVSLVIAYVEREEPVPELNTSREALKEPSHKKCSDFANMVAKRVGGSKNLGEFGKLLQPTPIVSMHQSPNGNIHLLLSTKTKHTLDQLWELYHSRTLEQVAQKTFVTPESLQKHNLDSATIAVSASVYEYMKCRLSL